MWISVVRMMIYFYEIEFSLNLFLHSLIWMDNNDYHLYLLLRKYHCYQNALIHYYEFDFEYFHSIVIIQIKKTMYMYV